MGSLNAQISLADPEFRKKVFCGLDLRVEVPYISLDKDERVLISAGVTFNVDNIVAFPSSLAVHRPVHQVPYYTFGRIISFKNISLYFLFPKLYQAKQKSSKLCDKDFQLWIDGILLPAIYQSYSSAYVQHYLLSYNYNRYNSTARGVETLTQYVHPAARE
ncbi:hypothetical protein M431DRAFT_501989 [Trichoderma harzianum CBS 226.95]|uniref:Uncharacterized protein n=1 Tax=Trichoderma harzianum CBS 226.95 TaxID=983964 RepID=A0A2T3ZRR0_TRIHA|nr:hypothetical protein M431DRAFT_501989 [Trichoderma harzianum CBS 226.95]PTB47506.1 hypothetical protein M431DRAFT_501989 [Trichoderma harzianum CBS 226.95]